MQLLSALSSTTSPLAMQVMPLVGSPAGDFAALIADMVPAGDAAVATGPVERQAAALGGNGLPVAIAAPVALVEMPVVAAPAVTPPLPASATEAVLMLPVEADAPVAKPAVAPVLAATAAIGVLASVLPEEETVEAPPRTEDVALRTLPMPVPTRFAAPQPRVKRSETPPHDAVPLPGEDEADEPDQPAAQGEVALPAPQPTPEPGEAILLPPAPPIAERPVPARQDATAAVVIEQGQVVAAEPAAATPPMRMAKRGAAAAPAMAQVPAPPTGTADPTVGVVTPLDTDRVVPVHVVVPQATDDAAPMAAKPVAGDAAPPARPGVSAAQMPLQSVASRDAVDTRPVASPVVSATSAPAVSPAPSADAQAVASPVSDAADMVAVAVESMPLRQPPADLAAPRTRPLVATDGSRPPEAARSASIPARPVVLPSEAVAIPQAVPGDVIQPRPTPSLVADPIAIAVRPAGTAAGEAIVASVPLPDAPELRPVVTDAVVADIAVEARRTAPTLRPLAETTPASVPPVARAESQPIRSAMPATASLPDATPVTSREAVQADRAPINGEAAASVTLVAAPAAQPVPNSAPVTRLAPAQPSDTAPVVGVTVDGTTVHAAIDAPTVAPATPPVMRVARTQPSDTAPVVEAKVDGTTVRHAVDAPAAAPATTPITRLAPAPVPDAVAAIDVAPVDADTLAPRPRRDDDLSVPTTGAPQAADAAVLRPVAPTSHAAQPTLDTCQPQWVEGMIDRIQTLRESSASNSGETRIRLSPDALGDVEVAVRMGDDGKLHVHFASDNADAGRLLAEAQPRLVQMAEARGLKLGGMQVDVGSQQSQRQAQDQGNPAPRAPRPATTQANTQTTRSDDRIA
ncbi:flagellar hook-length control protein FliK [Sphingomonas sp. ABOLH]|uniref:flagellar hook-length control protein FliK n=1 Tax=Sphingomonas sp. ABOLH TaxID=1985881 RepID=UPI0013DF8347|nr:flagellar hook-length control protein FliK [Sphingomonas sp. ABOLH]